MAKIASNRYNSQDVGGRFRKLKPELEKAVAGPPSNLIIRAVLPHRSAPTETFQRRQLSKQNAVVGLANSKAACHV